MRIVRCVRTPENTGLVGTLLTKQRAGELKDETGDMDPAGVCSGRP